MKLQVKYKKEKYDINYKDGFFIIWKELLLNLRRIKRFLLRVWNTFCKEALIALICIFIYCIVVIFLETNYMNCVNWKVALWDTKAEIFTVFVVVFIQALIVSEKKWKEDIKKWYWIYMQFFYKFTEDIDELNELLNFKYENRNEILYTRELFELYYEKLQKLTVNKEECNQQRLKIITKRMKQEMQELYYKVKEVECVDKDAIFYDYSELKEKLIKLESSDNLLELREEMLSMLFIIYHIIQTIRKIWRREINIDREIIDVLYKHNREKIENNYYYMLLRYRNSEE